MFRIAEFRQQPAGRMGDREIQTVICYDPRTRKFRSTKESFASDVKIVTGGQTGVDLAALQFARQNGLAYGGWVPKGRMNEAGRIPDHFNGLIETQSPDVSERTKLNVQSSDALLVFSDGSPSPGTQLTVDFAKATGTPCLIVDVRDGVETCARQIRAWLDTDPVTALNIAGPRASEAPKIGTQVTDILRLSLDGAEDRS